MEYRMISLIKAAIVYALCYLVQGYSYEKPGYLLLSPLLSLDHTTANLLDKHHFWQLAQQTRIFHRKNSSQSCCFDELISFP